MPTITCPRCGTSSCDIEFQLSHDEFCSECDFPLFWAEGSGRVSDGDDVASRGRLPGAGGLTCPLCLEPNASSAVSCARCGAELRLPALVPREPEKVVVLPPPTDLPEVAAVSNWNRLSIGLAVTSAVLALALVVVLITQAG